LTGRNRELQTLLGMLLLSTALWFVTFYLQWGIFWIKISVSASALAFISLPLAGSLSLYAGFMICGALIALTNGVFPAYMANRFEELWFIHPLH